MENILILIRLKGFRGIYNMGYRDNQNLIRMIRQPNNVAKDVGSKSTLSLKCESGSILLN